MKTAENKRVQSSLAYKKTSGNSYSEQNKQKLVFLRIHERELAFCENITNGNETNGNKSY